MSRNCCSPAFAAQRKRSLRAETKAQRLGILVGPASLLVDAKPRASLRLMNEGWFGTCSPGRRDVHSLAGPGTFPFGITRWAPHIGSPTVFSPIFLLEIGFTEEYTGNSSRAIEKGNCKRRSRLCFQLGASRRRRAVFLRVTIPNYSKGGHLDANQCYTTKAGS